MKKIVLIFILMALSSCNDYLEVMPDSELDIKIDTEEKVAELLTAAYPKASYIPFLEARTDNVIQRPRGVQLRLNEAMFYWQDYDQDDLDHPLFYWNACYKGIAQVNSALEHLKQFPEKTDRIKALYGEAFLLRAYLHFMVANIWSQPYNSKTSGTDLGIPYIAQPEKNALVKYKRGNVKDLYEAIEKDLRFGLELVDDRYYKVPKYHFNKDAAYAFASRFYLYKGEWDKVIAYSDSVLGLNPKKKLRNRDHYQVPPHIYSRLFNSIEEPANLLITSTESRILRNIPIEKFGYSQDFYFLKNKFIEFEQFGNTGVNPRNIYVANTLFRTEELLLNRAEAYAMKQNYLKAVEDLNYAVATQRATSNMYTVTSLLNAYPTATDDYTPFYPLTNYQASAVKVISEWRQSLYLAEGLRWFDIRRFYLSINRRMKDSEQNLDLSLKKNDSRRILQIPAQAISTGLEPNPR